LRLQGHRNILPGNSNYDHWGGRRRTSRGLKILNTACVRPVGTHRA
jgi:hypothetical protein